MSDSNELQKSDWKCASTDGWAGMVEQAVDVMMTSEVGDDRAGRRHEQDRSGLEARDHAAHEMPRWRPPWNRLVVVDAANVELQGPPRYDRNDLGETPALRTD